MSPYNTYKKGCRCDRCVAWTTAYRKKLYEDNAEANRSYSREYRTQNRIYLNTGDRDRYATVKSSTPSYVSGNYSSTEINVIVSWVGRDDDLARALGRNYGSVVQKKVRLKKEGLL